MVQDQLQKSSVRSDASKGDASKGDASTGDASTGDKQDSNASSDYLSTLAKAPQDTRQR